MCIRDRGGGVAIVFDGNKGDFKKLQLKSLVRKKLEIVAAVGKLNAIRQKHIIVAAYLPPSYDRNRNKEFMDALCDSISEIKTTHSDCWLTLGGDWNGRPLEPIINAVPELAIIETLQGVKTPQQVQNIH